MPTLKAIEILSPSNKNREDAAELAVNIKISNSLVS